MKSPQSIDRYADALPQSVRETVFEGTRVPTIWRREALARDYGDSDPLRKLAAQIKQHTLDHLDQYLEQAETRLRENGAEVLFANDAASANSMVTRLLRENGAKLVVKSKSMLTEELHLNPHLEENGIEVVETDLGEFIIQIDDDIPSHIIKPIVHKNRRDIAKSFQREGLGDYNDDPETITRRARKHLREKFLKADAGITGANFVSAESGRIVLVTNEGNARFCITAPRLHIVLVGIEKIVPHDRDFAVFLNLLARSGVGQQLTVYTQFINGPRMVGVPALAGSQSPGFETGSEEVSRASDPPKGGTPTDAPTTDGAEKMVVIFVDNGRSSILDSEYREVLRCIRCGACQNVCPVYRQASGHAYRTTYQGPIGAVLSPLLMKQDEFASLADLPKASSLCGACQEVCPVDIPIPDMLVRLRDRAFREGASQAKAGTPSMEPWAFLATRPKAWRGMMQAANLANLVPLNLMPVPPLMRWLGSRELPKFRGGEFRSWMKNRGDDTHHE